MISRACGNPGKCERTDDDGRTPDPWVSYKLTDSGELKMNTPVNPNFTI